MDEIPEIYDLETIEQVRALADDLRMGIADALAREAMTAKQLAVLLGQPPARTHYHVRELERVGLIKLVETREKGGILEKYYRAVGKGFVVPSTLLRGLPPDQGTAEMQRLLQSVSDGFLRTFFSSASEQTKGVCSMNVSSLWLSEEEYGEINRQIEAILEPYKDVRTGEGKRGYTVALIAYTNAPPTSPQDIAAAQTSPASQQEEAPALADNL
jgi:hypothetical protein